MSKFKKGDYVVFLTYNGGKAGSVNPIPTDYVYKLREDFTEESFKVVVDTKGSFTNGYINKLLKVLRYANAEEIVAYKKAGKPVPAIINFNPHTDYTGRYLKVLKDLPADYSIKIGDYLKILNGLADQNNIINVEKYGSLDISRIYRGELELMSENWTPESEITLQHGGFYSFEGTSYKYIFIFDTMNGEYVKVISLLTLDVKRFSKYPSNLVKLERSNKHKFKIATPNEKAHLEACIKANNYVEEADIYKEPKFIDGKNYKIISTYTYLYNRSSGKYISIDSTANYLDRTGSGFDSDNYKVVPITPEEEAHLEACIAAGRYVDPPPTIDYNNWSREALIEEAKRRYPIGTIVESLHKGDKLIVGKQSHKSYEDGWDMSTKRIWYSSDKGEWNSNPLIYDKGRWAEIIEESKPNTFNFVKGKYYKCNLVHDKIVFYFKFESLNEDELYVSESRSEHGTWNKSNGVPWLLSDNENFIEVSELKAKGLTVFTEEIALPGVGGTCVLGSELKETVQDYKNTFNHDNIFDSLVGNTDRRSVYSNALLPEECHPVNKLIDPGLPKILPEKIETTNIVLLNNSKIKIDGN